MQAIYNIVDNSIQQSPANTNVGVEVKVARETFRQVEGSYARSADGIGLHGGAVNIIIQKGEGTTVEWLIPFPCIKNLTRSLC